MDDRRVFERYLRDLQDLPLISAQQEAELANQIKQGDRDALKRLVEANLRFVVSVARQFQGQGLSLADLVAEGNVGLIEAAKRFDGTKGYKFISYAVWWIRQAILAALAKQSRIVRLPQNKIGQLHKIQRESSRLQQKLHRDPKCAEVAKKLDIEEENVSSTLALSKMYLSLDAPLRNDSKDDLKSLLVDSSQPPPDRGLWKESLVSQVKDSLNTLDPRESKVIKYYFGIDREQAMTLEEIGDRLGLTRERVRQIRNKAISRLRHISRSRSLRPYLE
ncbi:MAG: RNA polymerase subunit sigma [candidate division Zixibacteria bacterium SM23_81]|nr:MAG: RNA polymerase subunit sigma [candidate division Zixibacteria bacterium SM23_81]